MNRRIFVIQVFSGLLCQIVQIFFVTGRRRKEDGKKTITNDGDSHGFCRGSRAVRSRLCQWDGICDEGLCRDGRYNGAGIYNSRWLLYIMDGGKADGAFRQAGNRESCITGWKSMQRENPCPFPNLFHHRFGNGQGFLLYSMRVRAAIYLTMPAESLTPQSLHPFQTELHLSQIKQ